MQRLLQSDNWQYRGLAAISLAGQGKRPAISYFEEIFDENRPACDLLFRADSKYSSYPNTLLALHALAFNADREAVTFILKHPTYISNHELRQSIFQRLGASLCKRPELAEILLPSYTSGRDELGPEGKSGVACFTQEVFRHAGTELVPTLHDALQSKDRTVRSNAARACGAIGDASSIEPLIAALDLESGYSRASIVWALGELKAKEALPHMAGLYADAKNDEKRRQGQNSGFRASQMSAQLSSQYESLSNLDSIRSDWNELLQPNAPQPINPRSNEWLLTSGIILDAVKKIGPQSSQVFYRKLAAETDNSTRYEAAIATRRMCRR